MSSCENEQETEPIITTATDNIVPTANADFIQYIPVINSLNHLPSPSATAVHKSEYIEIDYSNAENGYIMVKYLSNHLGKVKFQIKGSEDRTYTYNLAPNQPYQTFPLTEGSGKYTLNTYEQSEGTKYYTVDSFEIEVKIINEFSPCLYPNQFVNYSQDSKVFDLSVETAENALSELHLIEKVYNKTMDLLSYDTGVAEKASKGLLAGYLPDLDSVIENSSGICFDYAALMVAMLRIQEIPTRLVIGYAGEAYHAWINVYTKETGWIDGIISFNGTEWSLMDPTFADNSDNKEAINKYIGDSSNYTEKYVY